MGCPSEVIIGDNLVFSVTSHDPDTGEATDADAVPSYRVYEDETGTPITSGSMAKLDDSNTTGFYTEMLACTAANGYEAGKTYTIYVQAAVGGTTGVISYGFKAVVKTGYSLASTGLDAIATTAPSGVASTFREMVVQVWRRFFKKATMTSTQIKTYADNGSTVLTTQAASDDGTTQTQGTST